MKTARTRASRMAWAGRQAAADVLNGTSSSSLTDWQARHGLDDSPFTGELWAVYCRVRREAVKPKPQPKAKRKRKAKGKAAHVSVASLMSTGLVPIKRSTQRHTMQLRGRVTPTSAGLPTLGKRR